MKLNARIKWLHEEIEKWVSENIISPQQAVLLKEKYPVEESKIPWGIIVFSSLGAVIAGLGVILLFAYNWHAIPRIGKLALIFIALAAAHITGFKLTRNQGAFAVLGEGLSLLGTMFFGAGIWLIAQIYHIEEHYPNAFMFWGLGAFLLAIAMPSIPQGVLAAVLLSIWCIVERTIFDSSMYATPIILAFGLFPLAWKQKSCVLLWVLLPAFVATFISVLSFQNYHNETIYFSFLLNFSAIFIALRFLIALRDDFPEAASIFGYYGWYGFYVMLYILCVPEAAEDIFRGHNFFDSKIAMLIWGIQIALCVFLWALVLKKEVNANMKFEPSGFAIYIVPLLVLLASLALFFPQQFGGMNLSIPCNLAFLGMSVWIMAQGYATENPKKLAFGSIMLILITLSRYFDLFDSLLWRGFIFITIGALLFGQGVLYAKSRRQKKEGKQ